MHINKHEYCQCGSGKIWQEGNWKSKNVQIEEIKTRRCRPYIKIETSRSEVETGACCTIRVFLHFFVCGNVLLLVGGQLFVSLHFWTLADSYLLFWLWKRIHIRKNIFKNVFFCFLKLEHNLINVFVKKPLFPRLLITSLCEQLLAAYGAPFN